MVQRVTYSIVDRPDGRFDVVAVLGATSHYAREGLMTLAEAENEVDCLRVLMAACGAPVVQSVGSANRPSALDGAQRGGTPRSARRVKPPGQARIK
jgi:hypothetical protein